MRGGGCSVQQSLTAEAVAIVKQALTLARRRGNAQVTPLHVASAMLASPTALLRSACRHSNSHPLQCKALELCFNVALNRLPTSTSASLFTPTTTTTTATHTHHPSLSNALVAALKRAQAHQRRGSLDTQQQPVLTLKIEVEQLLLSILDDPSVSRVMREAGFTSTQVKEKVEQAVSLQICSKSLSMAAPSDCKLKSQASPPPTPPVVYQGKAAPESEEEGDVGRVMEAVVTQKRRNTVVVGESVGVAERVVKKVMGRIEVGMQFISLPLFTLKGMSEERVEVKIVELRCLVRSCFNRGTTVFYLGDLQWVSEFLSCKEDCGYCPVRHMMMELRRLACGNIKGERICLIAVATYKTFMNCKTSHPSLQSLLELHPLTISSTTPATISTCLDLSLNLHSGTQAKVLAKNGEEEEEEEEEWWKVLSGNLVKEEGKKPVLSSRKRVNESSLSTSTGTPLWFHCRHESQSLNLKGEYEEERVGGDLCKKPSSDCGWAHNLSRSSTSSFHDRVLPFLKTSSSPSSISSISMPSSGGDPLLPNLIHTLIGWPVSLPRQQRPPPKEHQFWKWEKPELLSNPNSSPNSASSSEAAAQHEEVEEEEETFLGNFKEVKAERLGLLIRALEKKVPWQKKGVVYEIASTVLRCRSGTRQRDGGERLCTWLFFRGVDCTGKYAVAKELGRLVFGSTVSPVVIRRVSCVEDSAEGVVGGSSERRWREEEGSSGCCGYFKRFAAAVGDNPHRVFFMEGVEEADRASMVGIKRAMETGRVGGGVVSLQDAIVIFSCENSITSSSPSSSPPPSQLTKKQRTGGAMEEEEEGSGDSDGEGGVDLCASVSLDLNIAVEEEVEDEEDHYEQEPDVDIFRYVDKEIIFNSGEEEEDVI